MPELTQDNRLLAVTTSAGKDVLLLDSFFGEEGISRPFRFVLKMVAQLSSDGSPTGNPDKIVPHTLVGQSMTVRISLTDPSTGEDSGERYITGLCERFIKENQDTEFAHYTAVIVPWFSFLNYTTNCRVFQSMSVVDIIQAVVSDDGFSGQLKNSLSGSKTYATRDICVQYRETDFAFLSRLMESEGIYYYFEHSQ